MTVYQVTFTTWNTKDTGNYGKYMACIKAHNVQGMLKKLATKYGSLFNTQGVEIKWQETIRLASNTSLEDAVSEAKGNLPKQEMKYYYLTIGDDEAYDTPVKARTTKKAVLESINDASILEELEKAKHIFVNSY